MLAIYDSLCLSDIIFFCIMYKFIIHTIENDENIMISIISTFTPAKIINIIIITIANVSVKPLIIIIDDNKYPNDLFFINKTPEIIARGKINPKSMA